MRLTTTTAIATVTMILSLASVAHASMLGVAGDFNGFVFNNLSASGGDTEGRLAVGNNLTASSYAVASGGLGPAPPYVNPPNDHLVVGNNLNAQGGWQVFNGNAVYGVTLTQAPTTFCAGCNTHQGTPVNFAAAKADLQAKSLFWGSLATNASVVFDGFSTLTLTATNPGLNVFNVNQAQWQSTSSKLIVNPFPNATLLINIPGTNVTQSNGMSYNGSGTPSAAHSKVLFNYSSALTLNNTNMAVLGSVLAPFADLTIHGGNIDGVGIANNVVQESGGEFHNFKFTGDLPDPTPEPATCVLCLQFVAVAAVAVVRRRRNARNC